MSDIGRTIIGAGVILVALGLIVMAAGKVPGLGKLPGDIFVRKEHFSFYFPLTTCILLSILLSLIMHFFGKK